MHRSLEKHGDKKEGFSSALAGGAAKEFQPHPCKIRYLFWINPTKCFLPSQHSYLLVWQQQRQALCCRMAGSQPPTPGPLHTGRVHCSVKPRSYCKARTVTALSCHISEATRVTRASATREKANLGMYLAIPCLSAVPFPVTRAHTLERGRTNITSGPAGWSREALRDPPVFCLKTSK